MRSTLVRFAVLCAGIAAVVSCDAGPTVTRFGNGIAGGSGGTQPVVPPAPGTPDNNIPFIRIITTADARCLLAPRTQINVGDPLPVCVQINDDRALGSVKITGFRDSGDPNLGTFVRTLRYTAVTAPTSGTFSGVLDSVVTRLLYPALPVDSTIGPMVVEAVVTDSAGNVDTATTIVNVVLGPRVIIEVPEGGSEWPAGQSVPITIRVSHPVGVSRDSVIVSGSWVPSSADTIATVINGDTGRVHTIDYTVPAGAVVGSSVTITATARDVSGNPGIADPVTVTIRAAGTRLPLVYQTVDSRHEIDDFIKLKIDGDNIDSIGRKVYFLNSGTLISDFGKAISPTRSSQFSDSLPLNLSLIHQDSSIYVVSYAVNTAGVVGWSLASSSVTTSEPTEANAAKGLSYIVFGRTFLPPRSGVMGDVTVHPNGSVFVSNTSRNLLEVWNNTSKTFTASGVAVGAQPWGMSLGAFNDDTLFVANSGATTISRVCVESCAGGVPVEDLSTTPGRGRIRTRNNVNWSVQWSQDDAGKIRLKILEEISYSDRPQYVVQSAGGRIFYSTRPTSANQAGTIRWLDPALPVPDPRQIHSYGTATAGDAAIFAIFNADSIEIIVSPPTSAASDLVRIYDHPYGAAVGEFFVEDSMPADAALKARLAGGDVEARYRLDLLSLRLTDTTFVSASIDRKWVAFGEGNTRGGTGRVMMINDPPGFIPGYFSPAQTVTDIVHNASERVFGLAVDSAGIQVAVHGLKTYTASIDLPFHLRLDGEYDSFDDGAGVAFHPRANSTGSLPDFRLAFSATASGVIEILDVAHYNNRGRLITKGTLYGALRASAPLPGDPPEVVMKLFGLTSEGLIVIDVRQPDIKPPL